MALVCFIFEWCNFLYLNMVLLALVFCVIAGGETWSSFGVCWCCKIFGSIWFWSRRKGGQHKKAYRCRFAVLLLYFDIKNVFLMVMNVTTIYMWVRGFLLAIWVFVRLITIIVSQRKWFVVKTSTLGPEKPLLCTSLSLIIGTE